MMKKVAMRKKISRSARDDYRRDVESIVGHGTSKLCRQHHWSISHCIAKRLASNSKTTQTTQPSKHEDGNLRTSTDQQLELWANFLEKKFAAQPGEPEIELHADSKEDVPPPTFDEVEACVKQLKTGKATGPDKLPIKQCKCS